MDWIYALSFIPELLIPHNVVSLFCFTSASIGVGGVSLHLQYGGGLYPRSYVDIVYHIHETMRNVYHREATYQATSQADYNKFYPEHVV